MNTNARAVKLEKIVLSGGYGNKTTEEIMNIKKHLSKLLESLIKDKNNVCPQSVLTKCKKPNAVFRTKKYKGVGLKLTLRKTPAKNLLAYFEKTIPNFKDSLTYNNSTLFFGLKDHRLLKLERYNYAAPEYGLNMALVYNRTMDRVYNRKYRTCNKKKILILEDDCRTALTSDLNL